MPWLTQSTFVRTRAQEVLSQLPVSQSIQWLEKGRPSLILKGGIPELGQKLEVCLLFGLYQLSWDVVVTVCTEYEMELSLVEPNALQTFHSRHTIQHHPTGAVLRESVEFTSLESSLTDVLREAVWMHPLRWNHQSSRLTQVITAVKQQTA